MAERNDKDVDTVAIVIAGWNNVVRNKNRNTGLFDMKLKQLQLLGHKSLVVSSGPCKNISCNKNEYSLKCIE